MKSRSIGMSWMIALLAACSQAPAPQAGSEPAPAAAPPAATAAAAEPEEIVEARVDTSDFDQDGAPEDEDGSGELSCKDDPLATHFFTLVGGDTVDDCGRADPKVLAAFTALMKSAAAAEASDKAIPPLRERLLSGPSGPGERVLLDGQPWWFYTACQAHDCPGTALAMLYSPQQSKMVGRLTARCRVWWLGEPTAEQRGQIAKRLPLDDAALSEDSALCE